MRSSDAGPSGISYFLHIPLFQVILSMTSSAMQDFLSEVVREGPIPANKLAYFQTRLSGNVHQAMLKVFALLERQSDSTRRDLAHRIGRKPEQITRWFSYPGNLTLGTVSDIFIGMGYELESVTLRDLASGKRLQFPEQHIDWVRLAGLDGSEEVPAAHITQGRRSAACEQVAHTDSNTEAWGSYKSTRHSALQGLLPMSQEIGRADAAQLAGAIANSQMGLTV
jgi:hypothetical protein